MGIFSALFGKKNNARVDLVVRGKSSFSEDYYDILITRPSLVDYFGRSFDLPAYNDSFKTGDGHKLREWLLLVWWGKTKQGRKSSTAIPKYFFSQYNLNAEKVTRKLKVEGYLEDLGEKTKLTAAGREFYDKYATLWEIHSFKGFPTNLDIDFPTWDKTRSEIDYYRMKENYLRDSIAFYKRMIDYLNQYGHPDGKREAKQDIDYYISTANSEMIELEDLKQKIEILLEK